MVLLPTSTVAVLGLIDIEKLGAVTFKVTLTECVSCPLVPVIHSAYFPRGVAALVVTVRVELPDPPSTGLGFRVAVAPTGRPLQLRFTLPVKPATAAIATPNRAVVPCLALSEVGLPEIEKSGLLTANVAEAWCESAPFVPVTVKVKVPGVVAPVVVMVSTEAPEPPGMGLGLNVAAAPAGSPLALR